MKTTRDDVLNILYKCLAELNEQLVPSAQLKLAEDTRLSGDSGALDSLGMVNLVTSIEDKLESHYGLHIPLPAADSTASGVDPWCNVGTFATFLVDVINERLCARQLP
jgi:D-alanine--poly(phosphoribitol) ligase subunit 2